METAITAGWGIGKGTSSLSNSASNANVDQGNGFFLKYKTYNFLSGLFYGTGNIVPKEMRLLVYVCEIVVVECIGTFIVVLFLSMF